MAANPKHTIEFYDESVRVPFDSSNSDYIKQGIRQKIDRASTFLCI